MKDLYTFDVNEEAAHKTYEEVRKAYVAFLEELKLPYLVARADSGNMGGTLSHEYHFASKQGEDTIIQCDRCDYSINEELYVGRYNADEAHPITAGMLEFSIFLDLPLYVVLQSVSGTYGHRSQRTEDPVRSPVLKLRTD